MFKEKSSSATCILPITRRRFVQGLAAAGAIAALDPGGWAALAEPKSQAPPILSGTHFDLVIDYLPVNFTGHRAIATAVNGSVPGPTLRFKEGDTVTLAVTNRLKVPSSIHWHALRLPADMDGVPGLSFPGIASNETFVYKFPVVQNGTYWYHSHSRFQEQTGLLGAIVIDPQEKHPVEFDREYIVMFTDWTDTDPEIVFSNLKQQSDYYNFHQRTAGTFFSEIEKIGLRKTLADRLAWGRMNMRPTDISDVSGATYTYLLNGNPPNANWTALFQPGERIRIRFINGSSQTFFDVRIPGLPMTIVSADGNDTEPVTVDEFRMGVAEIYDVIVKPPDNAAYTIFAQSEDRTGFACGTLATREGMTAPIPPMDPRPMRTMVDMGMGGMAGMAGMNMAGIDGMTKKDMEGTKQNEMSNMPGMENMPGMNMGDKQAKKTPSTKPVPSGESGTQAMSGMNMSGMKMGSPSGTTPFPQPGPNAMPLMLPPEALRPKKLEPSNPVHLKVGPQVDMVPMMITERLNDPGDGCGVSQSTSVGTYSGIHSQHS